MWKSVAPDYEVSTSGEVRSWKSGELKILTPHSDSKGYLVVHLSIDGKSKFYKVHRLVAQAFIPNPDGKPCVNHRNGVKSDNRVENLEWCTNAENVQHAYDTKLKTNAQGEDSPNAKLTNADACYIRDNPDHLTCKQLGEKFGVTECTISAIQRGKKYRTAGGRIRRQKKYPWCVPDAVRDEIQRMYQSGTFSQRALAKQFGVSHSTVRKIVCENQR